MTANQVVRRIVKPLLWLGGLTPLAWMLYAGFTGGLTADPVKGATHFTGRVILVILFLTLTVTTVRRFTRWNALIQARRLIGLFAFFYAVIHLLIYFVFDRGLVFAELGEDIAKRPYITVGFTAWLILLTLALTSPQAMVRRLGRRWQAVHRLIWVAVPLGLLHFSWAQKKDLRPALVYVALFAIVIVLRLGSNAVHAARQRAGAGRARGARLDTSADTP